MQVRVASCDRVTQDDANSRKQLKSWAVGAWYETSMRALVVVAVLTGCHGFGGGERGSGTPKTEAREVAAFTHVSLEGSMNADITVGSAQAVELSGDDNIVPLIVTEVRDHELRVRPSKPVRPKLDLVARIATPTLTALAASGSTDIELRGIAGDAFAIDASGSTELTASGTVQKLTIEVSGSAKIDATAVKAQNVTLEVSGSAELDVYASDVLDVHISGSATVRYAGSPRDVRKAISGSATIEPR